jgi:hypothetical protein
MLTTFQIFALEDLSRAGFTPCWGPLGRRPTLSKKGSTDILAANKTPVFGRVIALWIGRVAQMRDGVVRGRRIAVYMR